MISLREALLKRKKKLVEIIWIDHTSQLGWASEETIACYTPMPTVSYGLLLQERGDLIVLASSFDEETYMYGNREFIPKGCIKKIRVIK